jgi:hypothetical protein
MAATNSIKNIKSLAFFLCMGWFHKTLEDAEKAVREGRTEDAKRIVEEHWQVLHGLDSDLANAGSILAGYEQSLRNARTDLYRNRSIDPNSVEQSLKAARERIVLFERIMVKLIKEGRFEE